MPTYESTASTSAPATTARCQPCISVSAVTSRKRTESPGVMPAFIAQTTSSSAIEPNQTHCRSPSASHADQGARKTANASATPPAADATTLTPSLSRPASISIRRDAARPSPGAPHLQVAARLRARRCAGARPAAGTESRCLPSSNASYTRAVISVRIVTQSPKSFVHARMPKSSELGPKPLKTMAGAGSGVMPGVPSATSRSSSSTRRGSEP